MPGVLHNRIIRHVQSSTSNPASSLVLVKQRNLCRAYTTTHLKYPGHRRRHGHDTVHNEVRPSRDTCIFASPFFFQVPIFRRLFRKTGYQRDGHTRRTRSFGVQGNPQVVSDNDRYTCFYIPAYSPLLVRMCQTVLSCLSTTCTRML